MKAKNPIKAVFLNVIFPGLGCAYFGRWGFAIAHFFWTILLWVISGAIASIFTQWIPDAYLRTTLWGIIVFAMRIRILYEIVYTPYSLAQEHNQKVAEAQLATD